MESDDKWFVFPKLKQPTCPVCGAEVWKSLHFFDLDTQIGVGYRCTKNRDHRFALRLFDVESLFEAKEPGAEAPAPLLPSSE